MKKKKNSSDEVEVMLVNGKFYLASSNPKYQSFKRRVIPKKLWDLHNDLEPQAIDVHRQIILYFRPLKDKPMRVERYHVESGKT